MKEGVTVKIFLRNFLPPRCAENFHRGIFQCFTKFGYQKRLSIRGGGREEVSIFSNECFFSQRAKNPPKGTRYFFTIFGYGTNLGINHKNIWNERDSDPKPAA